MAIHLRQKVESSQAVQVQRLVLVLATPLTQGHETRHNSAFTLPGQVYRHRSRYETGYGEGIIVVIAQGAG